MRTSRARLCSAAVLVIIVSGVASAQSPKRDAKVQTAIDQMTSAYRALNAVHIKMTLRSSVSDPSIIRTSDFPERVEIRLQKPNKLVIDSLRSTHGKPRRTMVVSDGVYLWRWDSADSTVSKSRAPASLLEIKDLPNDSPEMEVLFRNKEPFTDFAMNGTEIPLNLGGAARFGDADTDAIEARLPAEGSPISGVLRVRIGQKDHLVRSVSFEGGGKDPKLNKEVTFKFEMTYPILNPAPLFAPDDFRFVPPAGARVATAPADKKSVSPSPRNASK